MTPAAKINAFIADAKEKYPALRKLEDESVVEFGAEDPSGVYVEECCDNWFFCTLTVEDVLQLAGFMQELAEAMKAAAVGSSERKETT